jgi:Stage III sporulation protein D.
VQEYIKERCLLIACYMLENNATVRGAAKKFSVSKSSVHKDMIRRLPEIDAALGAQVADLLAFNKAVRHLRGGRATKEKYASLRIQAPPV